MFELKINSCEIFWNLCIDFCSPHQSCVFVLIRGGGMFFVLPNLKRQRLIRKMYSYFLLQVTKIRWARTQKFSPGSVPEPNHTKTLNMCLVNSYFSSHICLNPSTLLSKVKLKDQRNHPSNLKVTLLSVSHQLLSAGFNKDVHIKHKYVSCSFVYEF